MPLFSHTEEQVRKKKKTKDKDKEAKHRAEINWRSGHTQKLDAKPNK